MTKFPAGIRGAELEQHVLAHGCFSPERNKAIYEKWFRNSPRYLFKTSDQRFGLTNRVLCDIGCSYGMNLVYTKEGSYGVEISQEYTDFANGLGLTVYCRDVCTADLSDLPKVEAVWCCAVLEHVDAPHIFLRKLWTLLQPDGLLVMWVPTIPPLARLLKYIPGLRKHLTAHTHSDHINAFSPAIIRFMCERAGFETVELNALYPWPLKWLGKYLFLLDGVMYVGKKKETVYFGNATRIGKAEYFDAHEEALARA